MDSNENLQFSKCVCGQRNRYKIWSSILKTWKVCMINKTKVTLVAFGTQIVLKGNIYTLVEAKLPGTRFHWTKTFWEEYTRQSEKTNICLIVHTQVEWKFKYSYLMINLMTQINEDMWDVSSNHSRKDFIKLNIKSFTQPTAISFGCRYSINEKQTALETISTTTTRIHLSSPEVHGSKMWRGNPKIRAI